MSEEDSLKSEIFVLWADLDELVGKVTGIRNRTHQLRLRLEKLDTGPSLSNLPPEEMTSLAPEFMSHSGSPVTESRAGSPGHAGRDASRSPGQYPRNNWREGRPWMDWLDSTFRHLLEWKEGLDADATTGLHPIKHALCDLAILLDSIERSSGPDDRWVDPKYRIELARQGSQRAADVYGEFSEEAAIEDWDGRR